MLYSRFTLLAAAVLSAAGQPPHLLIGDVRNAADHSAGGVAPGEVIALYPANAGPDTMVPWGTAANLAVTNSLGQTRIYFDGVPAPIMYTVRGRMGTVVPQSVAGREFTELAVEYEGRRSAPVRLPVVASAPAIFTLDGSGKGQAAMLNETGCCNSVRNPALLGSVVSLYATGEGKLSPGHPAPGIAVTVGGVPAEVVFTDNDGSLQVDFRVPLTAPAGDAVPITFHVNGRPSQPGVTLALRAPSQRVLIVERSAALRDGVGKLLRASGFSVLSAPDPASARNLTNRHPDLLILDLSLPEAGAREVISRIRETHPQVRILALARTLDSESLREADLLGAQFVLPKPLNHAKLLSGVRYLLRPRAAVY